MRRLVFVSSEPALGESIVAGLPSDVELVAGDGDLERIVSALRAGPVEVLWDLSAEWLSPQMLLELLSDELIERSRWLWLRREQTRFEDIPEVGESLLLPMAPQLIVARLYPRRSSVQPEIRGAFEAMSLPDLLQTVGMNQRDVRVTLDFDGEAGVLELHGISRFSSLSRTSRDESDVSHSRTRGWYILNERCHRFGLDFADRERWRSTHDGDSV